MGNYDDNNNQEEDLCRRLATFYKTLAATNTVPDERNRCYPFGPSTCQNPKEPERYCDVLFTPYSDRDPETNKEIKGLVLTRRGEDEGIAILPEDQNRRCCIVSAAPPRSHRAMNPTDASDQPNSEDTKLLFQTVTSIFVAPVLKEPRCTTLILGAWGCGSRHKNGAERIAPFFAQAVVRALPELDVCLGN